MELNLQELTQLSEQMDTLYYILIISLCIAVLVLAIVIIGTIFIFLTHKKTDEKIDNLLEYHELTDDKT